MDSLLLTVEKHRVNVLIRTAGRWKKISELTKRNAEFISARLAPSGELIATIYLQKEARTERSLLTIWKCKEETECQEWEETWELAENRGEWDFLGKIAFSASNSLLASNFGGRVRVWDIPGRQEHSYDSIRVGADVAPEDIGLSSDGRLLATYVYNSQTRTGNLQVLNRQTGDAHVIEKEVYSDLQFSPNSMLLGFTTKTEKQTVNEHTVLEIIDIGSWTTKQTIQSPPRFRGISAIGFGSNETVTIGGNGRLRTYLIESGECIGETEHPGPFSVPSQLKNEVTEIQFFGANLLLTVGEDGVSKIWVTSFSTKK